MKSDNATYLTNLQKLLAENFNLEEIRTLCFNLHIDYETVPGAEKSSIIRELLLGIGRNGRLPELVTLAQKLRPHIDWSPVPDDFEMPELLNDGETAVLAYQHHVYGDVVQGDKFSGDKIGGDKVIGDKVAGDKITHEAGATAVYQGLTVAEVAELMVELKRVDQPQVWDGRIPYLGLQAFQEDDAQYFFGREKVVNDLLARVKNGSFLAIAGPSGSGKSSVARAGLLHALQQGYFERSQRWLFATMHPGGNPIEQLAQAVNRLAQSPVAGDYIREKGLTDPHALHEQIEALLKEDARQRTVLLVDQFEEIFSPNQDAVARMAFIHLLAAVIQTPQSRTKIILTLRSDFIPACADYPQLNELINQQFYQVGAMERHDLSTAIILPALEVGAKIDPELVSHITAAMKGEPGALPLMSFALSDLFEATHKKKGEPLTLSLSDYLQRGGIENALQRHADHAFAQFSAPQQELTKYIFSRLVEVGERVDTRRTVTLNELIPTGKKVEEVADVIHTLASDKVRLLTMDRMQSDEADASAQTTVTIAHEKLIDAWPWLRRLVDENREAIALQNQITSDAQAWAKEQDAGYLYRGGRLAQMTERLAKLQPNLNELSQQFIEVSRAEQERQQVAEEQQQRNEAELHIQREVNKRIQTSQLAFAAQSELSKDPERALLLAVASLGINIQPDTRSVLADSLQSRYRATLYGHANHVGSAVFSPDGQTILTASWDGTARLWDKHGGELVVLRGHTNLVRSAVFSPDGQTILTTSNDRTARLWDRQGNELVIFNGHTNLGESAVFSPDGQIILAHDFGAARLWDGQGNALTVLQHEGEVHSAVFSPDGQTILTTGCDERRKQGSDCIKATARLWDRTGNELTVLRGHDHVVGSGMFSPDGQTILTASWDGTARLWDRQGNELTILRGHESSVGLTMFSPDGKTILTASSDGTARLWDRQGNELTILRGHEKSINSAVFSPDGETILTASNDHTARLWDRKGNELAILRGHDGSVQSAVFSPNGQTILTASWDGGTARLWAGQGNSLAILCGDEKKIESAVFSPDGQTIFTTSWGSNPAQLWDVQGNALAIYRGHEGFVNSAVLSPDGQTVLTTSGYDPIRLWDKQGKELSVIRGHEGFVNSAVLSPDGKTILTANSDGTIQLWDRQGNELAILRGHEQKIKSAVFSPDKQTILTASWDCTARLWDRQGNELAVLHGHEKWVKSAVFSSNGESILTASDDTVQLWDGQGNASAILRGHEDVVISAIFSSDGQTILTTSYDRTARLWDVLGNELVILRGHEGIVGSAVFSSDGQTILTASEDCTARLWDRQGNELVVFRGHKGGVASALFSSDEKTILTAGSIDRTARLWDIRGNTLAVLRGHTDSVRTAVFSPDEQIILTTSKDGTAQLWPNTIESMVSEAFHRLQRGFTEDECQQYFRDDPATCPRTKEELFTPLAHYLNNP